MIYNRPKRELDVHYFMTPNLDLHGTIQHDASTPVAQPHAHYPSRILAKGDTLYRDGDQADTTYRVEEGLLKLSIDLLTGKERIIGVAGPGDYIGALTPAHIHYDETALALSQEVRVSVLPSDLLAPLKEEVATAAGRHMSRLRDSLEDGELPVPSRLARTFVRLGERFGHINEEANVRLTLPLTHDNFAAMVGAARETTTAVLSEMRDEGVLEGTRGRYHFNLNDLSDYASNAAFH